MAEPRRGQLSGGPRVERASTRRGGFTLIEILVVLVIISILASLAVLSIPRLGGGSQLDEQVRRLTSLVALASEEALLQGRDIGLRVEQQSYRFYVFDPDSFTWQDFAQDRTFRERTLPEGMRMELTLEGREVGLGEPPAEDGGLTEPVPQILLLSSGEQTPFELVLESENADYRYLVTGLAFGGTEVSLEEAAF